MSRKRRSDPTPSTPEQAWMVLGALSIVGVVIGFFGLPVMVPVAIGIIIASGMYPRPELTGKHPVNKLPIPATPMEQAEQDTFRFVSGLPGAVFNPLTLIAFHPGMVVALAAGIAAFFTPAAWGWVPPVNAALAVLIVAGWQESRRRANKYPQPPVGWSATKTVVNEGMVKVSLYAVLGAAAGVGVVLLLFWVASTDAFHSVRQLVSETGDLPEALWQVTGNKIPSLIAGGVAGAVFAGARPWRQIALEHWDALVGHREEWGRRWEMAKTEEPFLEDFEMIGEATLFTFDTQGRTAADQLQQVIAKNAAIFDASQLTTFTTLPKQDSSTGQPLPGSVDPRRFQITVWPSDQFPALDEVDPQHREHLVQSAVSMAAQEQGDYALLLSSMVDLCPDEDDPGMKLFALTFYGSHGVSLRQTWPPALAQALQCDGIGDHRAAGGAGVVFLGNLGAEPRLDLFPHPSPDAAGALKKVPERDEQALREAGAEHIGKLALEDEWERAWLSSLKTTVNPPVIRNLYSESDKLAKRYCQDLWIGVSCDLLITS